MFFLNEVHGVYKILIKGIYLLEFYKTKGHIEESGVQLYALQMLGAMLSYCPKCRWCKIRKLRMKRWIEKENNL